MLGSVLDEVRLVRQQVRDEANPAPPVQAEPPLPDGLAIGDRVWVKTLNCEASIVNVGSRDRVEIQVGSARMKLKRRDLAGVSLVVWKDDIFLSAYLSECRRRLFPYVPMETRAICEAADWTKPLRRLSNIVTGCCYRAMTSCFYYMVMGRVR